MTPQSLLNAIANQPDIREAIAPGHAEVDLSKFFNDPRHVMLGNARGVALFFWKGLGIYSGHYLFTKALRGREALLAARQMLDTMFTTHSACVILGKVPRSNRASRAMTRALGFRPVGTSTDISGRPCIDYKLDRESWVKYWETFSEAKPVPTKR